MPLRSFHADHSSDGAATGGPAIRRGVGMSMTTIAHGGKRGISAALAAVLLLTVLATGTARAAGDLVSVIVRALPGHIAEAERVVSSSGGRVGREIKIIDGFSAQIPAGELGEMRASGHVYSVTPNGSIHLLHYVDGFNAANDAGSAYNTTKLIGAQDLWRGGVTGQGVDVAMID